MDRTTHLKNALLEHLLERIAICRALFRIGFTAARSDFAYISEVLGRTIFLTVILYIFLRLWQATYNESGAERLGGLTIADMLWYLTLSEAIVLSDTRLSHKVDEDVRSGTLAITLLRPLPYPLYRLAVFMGERTVRFASNMAAGSIVAFLLIGLPSCAKEPIEMAQALPVVLAIVLIALLLDGLLQLIIGLGAFWMEDTSGLTLIYSRLRMILGGMLIPIQLLPGWIQPALEILPFTSIIYAPAHLFVSFTQAEAVKLFLHQILWILIASVATILVYKKATIRVSTNGG